MIVGDVCHTRLETLHRLLKECEKYGSQKAFAASIGVSDAYMSDMLTGKREFSDRALHAVGLERRMVYVSRFMSDRDVADELNKQPAEPVTG